MSTLPLPLYQEGEAMAPFADDLKAISVQGFEQGRLDRDVCTLCPLLPTTCNLVKAPRRSQNSYIFTGQGTSCHVQLGAIGEEKSRWGRRDGTHAADKFSLPVPLPRASSVRALLSRVSLDGTADVARSRSTRVVVVWL